MSRRFEAWAGRQVSRDAQGQFAATPGQNLLAQRISALIGRQRGESDDYKMQHQPPDRDYGAPMHDPEGMAPDLMAHPEWYSTGDSDVDGESIRAIQRAVREGPDKMTWIYRAAPVSAGRINPGNWVTPSKTYAKQHMEGETGWKVYARRVRAGDLVWEGNSIAEWGWMPEAPGFEARTTRRASKPSTAEGFTTRIRKQYPDVKLDLHGRPGGLMVLSRIVVPERSRGTGSAIMREMVDMADRTGTTLTLDPSSHFGGNKTRLIAFYKRFGFVQNKGRNKDYEISQDMYRVPR